MKKRLTIWIDITNTPHVNVLKPLISYLSKEHTLFISARDFSETVPLLNKNKFKFKIIGKYKGKNRINKVLGMFNRFIELQFKIPKYDLSISLGGNYTAGISKLRKKTSIVLSDNDISFKAIAYKFGSFFIFPKYFNTTNLSRKYDIKDFQIKKYDGFKEDIYIADYKPDKTFLEQLPFNDFITIRPENLKASYVPTDSVTIVPELFEKLKDQNILFLPRYPEEREYAKGYSNIYIPNEPLNGLDVCYFASAMLTGAGTFAREAAILGTPAVSFFPGKIFLTVDEIMSKEGKILKSRNVDEISDYVQQAVKNKTNNIKSQQIQKEVFEIVDSIVEKI